MHIARAIRRRDWRPNVYFHVIMRGNNRANVYNDEQDKYHLMRFIGEAHQRFKFTMVAFCIMSNHFHLLIRSEEELSKIMAVSTAAIVIIIPNGIGMWAVFINEGITPKR
ncbi:transposase [Sporosarcina sp. SAFN-010]|uniref:transposase n=1 Tax=Sporosarcina sp. SAFN-010 TaxID=3387273 RepID=UPI003F7EF851